MPTECRSSASGPRKARSLLRRISNRSYKLVARPLFVFYSVVFFSDIVSRDNTIGRGGDQRTWQEGYRSSETTEASTAALLACLLELGGDRFSGDVQTASRQQLQGVGRHAHSVMLHACSYSCALTPDRLLMRPSFVSFLVATPGVGPKGATWGAPSDSSTWSGSQQGYLG